MEEDDSVAVDDISVYVPVAVHQHGLSVVQEVVFDGAVKYQVVPDTWGTSNNI